MNHVNVSVRIGLTPDETMSRLASYLRENAPQAEITFTMRAPFDVSSLNVGVTLHREVTARFAPLGNNHRAYAISWQPAVAGPFPAFAGTIFVGASDTADNMSVVTLDGHYHPPMGVAGEMFDALVGKHIASASATDLLERIATHIDGADAPASAVA